NIRSRKRKPASSRRDEAVDPVLPEKKRARRRLVGAVALVLAAIIGLPMILDSEPKPLADDIAIRIPSRDSASAPVRSVAENAEPAEAALDEQEELVAPPDAAPAPDATPPAAPTPAPAVATAVPRPAPSSAAKPAEPTPPAKPAPAKPEPSPAPERRVRDDEGARALALLEGRTAPAAEKKAEKYVIQVAALASQEKVNELQGKLKRAGIASFTQKVGTGGGAATRIRVGPFTSRDEAEKVRARIVKLGLNGTLVPV
ncbi:MAG TPA: SPOR domain-containing protein, partial [Noviherbaspirillum sp.]